MGKKKVIKDRELRIRWTWVYDLLFLVVLALAGYFRFTGTDWGNLNIQHPDENFLSSVTLAIQPVGTPQSLLGMPPTQATQNWRRISPEIFPDCSTWGGYFDTNCSPLNPNNHGFSFYVYGDLPIIMTRYLATWLKQIDHLTLFGRFLSGFMDLGTILLLYLIVKRVYNARLALLASVFSAVTVMQIQQSHFYTTDNFAVFFMFLTIYFAARIAIGRPAHSSNEEEIRKTGDPNASPPLSIGKNQFVINSDFAFSIFFGVALGMAMASKINAAPLAGLLPLAFVVRYWRSRREQAQINKFIPGLHITGYLLVGALFSIISFRIFQPYAFAGWGLNPQWLANLTELRLQSTPNSDIPWALQWARRNHLYSFQNLTLWGFGLPLGILSWSGFLWMGWRILKGEWRKHILLWSWTAIYFLWQSLQYNPTMRYQLPVYPLLAMMAACGVVWLWDKGKQSLVKVKMAKVYRPLSITIGVVVLALSSAYAYGFSRIYVRPEPRIAASNWIYQNIPGPINLQIQSSDGSTFHQLLPIYSGMVIQSGIPFQTTYVSKNNGFLTSILLAHIADTSASGLQTLRVIISSKSNPQQEDVLTNLAIVKDFTPGADARGNPVTVTIDPPIPLQQGITYFLQIQTTGGTLALSGSTVANETDYDYPLPFRTASYDPYGGIYRGDLNLQVYYPDDGAKFLRFESILNQTDYIFIPTNHQYGQITRLPERYPLTTEYYRQLVGCPADMEIISCYRVAEPGMYQGKLGFDLIATFESYPTIGPFVINDQSAEEAFTFYDHPKVMIFKKNANFSPDIVQSVLGNVDYSQAVHLTPGQADTYKSLLLPEDQLAIQQAGGTWSELFDHEALYNQYPILGLILWYLVIFILGIIVYPIVRAAFPGLADHGYPLSRIVGLLLWGWLAWSAGSLGLTYSKTTIMISLGIILLVGVWQAWLQRKELKQELHQRWKYFLMVEVVFLAFFLVDLFIRLGNPDLWHPAKGGERPMDFAYFNAILKSSTFPPYDPWFAGGYINYYYYGFVLVGTPVKLLGIVPSIAYNFILPTLFACLAVSAFSLGWNIHNEIKSRIKDARNGLFDSRFFTGISAASAMVLVGNLGIVRMITQGFQKVAAPGGLIDGGNFIQQIWWSIKGFFMVIAGMHLPYGPGDWYWFSSRIFPPGYNEFYEFPVFTFIYSDLHAHMIALMLTLLAILWALSLLLSKARWNNPINVVLGFFMGGLIIGSLKPTNTWDFYTYCAFGVFVLAYTVWRYGNITKMQLPWPDWGKHLLITIAAVAALITLSVLLYQPFSYWFGQAYTSVKLWKGSRTPISTYLTQWGVFLFIIVSWMTWETRQWLAETPVSALRKLRPYKDLISGAGIFLLMLLIAQQIWVMLPNQTPAWKGITVLWLALPIAVWAAVLLLRPSISDSKRLVLFMIGTGLFLTMMVELIVVSGDIGRFNTVFKFGVQSWILLGISAAAAFGWLLVELHLWLPGWRIFWSVTITLLVSGAALVLLIGGADKIRDRMAMSTPHTLDSMAYMAYSTYSEYGVIMDLGEDYRAIRWMQETIQGSPVIVEAASAGVQYQWHQRFSIYTGLPDVVGWEWHEVQQRILDSATVISRGREVDNFYETDNLKIAMDFLHKYNVRYIIVGQLERAKYSPGAGGGPVPLGAPDGLLKFETNNNKNWQEVYRDGRTVIYEVLQASTVSP